MKIVSKALEVMSIYIFVALCFESGNFITYKKSFKGKTFDGFCSKFPIE